MRSISIKNKILLWSGACAFLTLGVVVAYSSFAARAAAIRTAQERVLCIAQKTASRIAGDVSLAMTTARHLSFSLATVKTARTDFSRETINAILRSDLENNPFFAATYTAWEPNAFDGRDSEFVNAKGHDGTGRFIPYWNRNHEGVIVLEPLVEYEDTSKDETGARKGDYYLIPRETRLEQIIEPYVYPVQGKPTLMTSLVAPILGHGRFYGIAGVDLSLDFLQGVVDNEDFYDRSGQTFILSNKGWIAAASGSPALAGKHIRTNFEYDWEEYLKYVQGGQEHAGRNNGFLTVFSPIRIGRTQTPWSIMVQVPESRVLRSASAMMLRQIGLGVLSGAAVLAGLWFIAAAIAKPVARTVRVAQLIARGDIAQAREDLASAERNLQDPGQDEALQLLSAISTMTASLASLLEQAQRSGVQLVSASTRIAATSREQQSTAGEFETLTSQVVTAVSEISATARDLARTVDQVREAASGAEALADSGRAGLRDMEEAMKRLSEAAGIFCGKLSVISQRAETIGTVVTTIKKVADQTNLLSLSAGIEAEKAGVHGRGFSVVAKEIRRLADQTAVATLDIEQIVKEMQSSVSTGVMEMDRFNREVLQGIDVAAQISAQMGQIIERVKTLTPQFQKVNEGMKTQAIGASQISDAMAHLSAGARQTAESVRQSQLSTESLRDAANSLQSEISRFKV